MAEHSLTRQASHLLGGRIITFLLGGIAPIILVRLMSPEEFGVFQQLVFVNGFAVLLLGFQLIESLYYLFPRYRGREGGLLLQTITVLSLVHLLGALLFLGINRFIPFRPGGIGAELLLPVAAAFFAEGVARTLDHVFILEKKPRSVLLVGPLSSLLRLGMVVGAVFFFHDLVATAWSLALYSAVRLAALLLISLRYRRDQGGFHPSPGLFREQGVYVLPLAASSLVGALGNNIDKLIIGATLSPGEFAVYSIGSLGLLYIVTFFYTSVGDVLVPRMGELFIAGDRAGVLRLWQKMLRGNLAVTIPVVVFCLVMAEEILSFLYTPKFIAGSTVWRINLIILLIQMTGYGYILKANGDTRSILRGNFLRFLIGIPLAFILVSRFGLVGGATSFVAGFSVNGVFQLAKSRRSVGSGWAEFLPWRDLLKTSVVSTLAASVLLLAKGLAAPGIIKLGLGAGVYFPLVFAAIISAGVLDGKILDEAWRRVRGR
jgi:O-antigen/teichoic acid export membrane protein